MNIKDLNSLLNLANKSKPQTHPKEKITEKYCGIHNSHAAMNNHFAFYITTRNVQQDLLLSLSPSLSLFGHLLARSKTRDI